jgi:3-phosphoshikimate 1-carboxyvinyltransferase
LIAIKALRDLGVKIEVSKNKIIVHGSNGRFKAKKTNLYVGNSGLTARCTAVLCSLADKDITITGSKRMDERPFDDLLKAMKSLGIRYKSNKNCLPLKIKTGSFEGGQICMKGDKSSQYFTALLIAAPYAKKDVVINTEGELVSKPYIDITIRMMQDFGAKVVNKGYNKFIVKSGCSYSGKKYDIEGDFSSASFFFAAAAITQGRVSVNNLNPDSVQGDKRFVEFLKMMGCKVNKGKNHIEVIGRPLKAINADMRDYPDIVVPLSVVAAFAHGTSRFYNISHLKYKESDRIRAIADGLKKIGVKVRQTKDSIAITGGTPHGAVIETYKDHRIAMSFAIAGLKVPGIIIKNPENVKKSYPEFFDILKKL